MGKNSLHVSARPAKTDSKLTWFQLVINLLLSTGFNLFSRFFRLILNDFSIAGFFNQRTPLPAMFSLVRSAPSNTFPIMPSLTCSPGCDGYFKLSRKRLELEQRISKLHQIKKHECGMDIIFGPTAAAYSAELADTLPYQPDEAT